MKTFLTTMKGKVIAGASTACVVGAVIVAAILINSGYRTILVDQLTGITRVENGGSIKDAFVGQHLKAGDDVTVSADSDLTLALDLEQFVYAEQNTHFWVEAKGKKKDSRTVIHLDKGSNLCRIDRKLKDAESFDVDTSNATMSVRGTVFRTSCSVDDEGLNYTLIEVFEGQVFVQVKMENGQNTDESRLLSAGESAIVRSGNDFSEFVKKEQDEIVSEIEYSKLPQNSAKFLGKAIDEGRSLCIGKDLLYDLVALIEHDFSEMTEETEASCTQEGSYVQVCSICGIKGETVITQEPLEHAYEKVEKEDGTVVYCCKICGAESTDTNLEEKAAEEEADASMETDENSQEDDDKKEDKKKEAEDKKDEKLKENDSDKDASNTSQNQSSESSDPNKQNDKTNTDQNKKDSNTSTTNKKDNSSTNTGKTNTNKTDTGSSTTNKTDTGSSTTNKTDTGSNTTNKNDTGSSTTNKPDSSSTSSTTDTTEKKTCASGHKYVTTTTDSTCEKEGVKTQICSVCGDKQETTIAKKSHSYTTTTSAATCTTDGVTVKVCSVCGDRQETVSEKATGHSYEDRTVAATCTTTGKLMQTCSVCGDYKETVTSPKTSHRYGSYQPGDASGHVATCSVCGATAVSGHSLVYTPSVSMDGHDGTCSVCGYSAGLSGHVGSSGGNCSLCGQYIK